MRIFLTRMWEKKELLKNRILRRKFKYYQVHVKLALKRDRKLYKKESIYN